MKQSELLDEAVERKATLQDTRYAVGVIFLDAKAQETKKTPFLN